MGIQILPDRIAGTIDKTENTAVSAEYRRYAMKGSDKSVNLFPGIVDGE